MTPSETVAAQVREAQRLSAQGNLPQAVAAYQRLLARWPQLADCWYNLGRLQRQLRQFDAALESYAQALRAGISRPEEVHLNRGVIYSDCLRQDAAAERELRAALALNPNYLPALQNLANLHEDLGQREAARGMYERMLTLEPHAFEALARYARLSASNDAALIARLQAALTHPAATAADQASLGFVLAGLHDAGGQYEIAFTAATAANRASKLAARGSAHYDRAAHERLVDELMQAFPHRRAPQAQVTAGTPRPLFICGMFRSGSTLTERLLAGNPTVAGGGELDLLPQMVQGALAPFPSSMASVTPERLAQLAGEYLQIIARLFPGATCVTDKRLDNFLYLGLIKALFPEARIVHTTRDALDTCLSIFFLHLDQRMAYALDLMDIGHYYRQYRRLMAHWQALYGTDILEFNYDTLVREPRAAAQHLLSFCGLEWDEACLEFAGRAASVKTASVWQVREALHSRSLGRARHYASQLAPLAQYLGEP
jgi:tetratricopeptide (TPR) repeat protein